MEVSNEADTTFGDLTFKNKPNYEKPADADKDNVYMVTVVATDSKKLAATRDVVITVENVDDDGTITFSSCSPRSASPSPPLSPTRTASWKAPSSGGGTTATLTSRSKVLMVTA